MTHPSLQDSSLPIIIVESSESIRFMMLSVLKNLGLKTFLHAAKPSDVLNLLSYEKVKWIIGSPCLEERPNMMHVLQITASTPSLRRVFVSFLLDENDKVILPKAFELGLLSFHQKSFVPDVLQSEFKSLLDDFKTYENNSVEVSSLRFRSFLKETGDFSNLVNLETKLSTLNAGSPRHFLNLAIANAMAGRKEEALKQFHQIWICFPDFRAQVTTQAEQTLGEDWKTPGDEGPIFENMNCHVLAGDDVTNDLAKRYLESIGLREVKTFLSADEYVRDVQKGEKPELFIFNWNLPDRDGVSLIQELQEIDGFDANILILSDFVDPIADRAMLRELGVFGTLKSPLTPDLLAREILKISRETWFPKAGESIEYKLRQSLKRGDLSTAEQYLSSAAGNSMVSEGQKLFMSAQIQFSRGNIKQAAKEAMQSVEKMGDSIVALNFLGKCMMMLGKFEAAISCYSKANEVAPGSIERLCQLSMAKFENTDPEGAAATLEEARKIVPHSHTIDVTEATQNLRTGDVDRARAILSQLKSHLGVGSALNNSAVANVRAGKLEDALQLYARAAEALPDDMKSIRAVIEYNHALAVVRANGDLMKAEELLRSAVECTGPDAVHSKAKSLLKRIQNAKGSAEGVKLTAVPVFEAIDTNGSEAQDDSLVVDEAVVFKPGDKSLLLVFKCAGDQPSLVEKVLADPPRFSFRKTLNFNESSRS